MTKHSLEILGGSYAIFRLAPDAAVPSWATGEVVSITRTSSELSIVCPYERALETLRPGIDCELDWRCFRVVGPLAFSLVGVVASLTRSLAEANVSVFVVSTYETDYLYVKQRDLGAAKAALIAAGHRVTDA